MDACARRPVLADADFFRDKVLKTAYTVEFSSEELIRKSVEALDRQIDIPKLTYTVRKAKQMSGTAFAAAEHESHQVDEHYMETGVRYDLVGKVAEGTTLTRRTVRSILSSMLPARFEQFRNNPEKFIAEVIRIVNEQKATMIVEHIQYHILEETYSTDIFTKNQMILPAQMIPIRDDLQPLQKHIYDYLTNDYLTTDSAGERVFAKELDTSADVVVYAKLPKGFSIPTPLGGYSPDWAIAFRNGSVKHVFFVAETKGSMSEMQLRAIEKAKIECAAKFFDTLSEINERYHVAYRKVASYQDLLARVNSDD